MDRPWVGGAMLACVLACVACGGEPDDPDAGAVDGGALIDAAPVAPCERNLDCAPTFCDPRQCMPGATGADERGCVSGTSPCPVGQACDDVAEECVACAEPDADDDEHASLACGGDDCDDDDGTRYPGAPEVCDAEGHDEDCVDTTFGDVDEDGDGYVSSACCNGDACGPDCDDTLADVHPGVSETCNGRDDDCDGATDEAGATPLCPGGTCTAGACRLDAWDHAFGAGGIVEILPTAIAMDALGGVYVAATFAGTAAFDDGPITSTGSDPDLVLIAYEADGTHRWTRPIEIEGWGGGAHIAAAPDGSAVYITGYFDASLKPGDEPAMTTTERQIYVVQLTASDGAASETVAFAADATPAGIVASNSLVRVISQLLTPATFEEDELTDDAVVLSFDASLELLSARPLDGVPRGLAPRPGGGFVIAGEHYGTADVGCAAPIGTPGQTVVFVASFTSGGDCEWVTSWTAHGLDVWDISTDVSDRVYVTGDYRDAIDFGGGLRMPPIGSGQSGFIVALDSDGSHRWDRLLSSPASARFTGLATRADGVVAVGSFSESLSFGGATLAGDSTRSSIYVDLSAAGSLRGSRTWISTADDVAVDVVVGRGNSTAIVGSFVGNLTLETATYTAGSTNGYVLRLPNG